MRQCGRSTAATRVAAVTRCGLRSSPESPSLKRQNGVRVAEMDLLRVADPERVAVERGIHAPVCDVLDIDVARNTMRVNPKATGNTEVVRIRIDRYAVYVVRNSRGRRVHRQRGGRSCRRGDRQDQHHGCEHSCSLQVLHGRVLSGPGLPGGLSRRLLITSATRQGVLTPTSETLRLERATELAQVRSTGHNRQRDLAVPNAR